MRGTPATTQVAAELPGLLGTPTPDTLKQELAQALAKPPAELWAIVERIARQMLSAGLLTDDDLSVIFGIWDEDEYAHMIELYSR